MTDEDTGGHEASVPQRRRVQRALDVVAVKTMDKSDKDDPVTSVPLRFLYAEAEAKGSTMRENGFPYMVNRLGGVNYLRNKGELRIKCKTYLRDRNKLDRIDNIMENPEDHIFEDGGVSAD